MLPPLRPLLHLALLPLSLILLILSAPSTLDTSSLGELRTSIFALASSTTLGAFLVLLERASDSPGISWFEGVAGWLGSIYWFSLLVPIALFGPADLPPGVVTLSISVTSLVLVSWALLLTDFVRHGWAGQARVGLIRLEEDNEACLTADTELVGDEGQVVCAWAGRVALEVYLFFGIAGGAARCLVASSWVSVRLHLLSPASHFLLPSFLGLASLFVPTQQHPRILSLALILLSHAITTHRVQLLPLVCDGPTTGESLAGLCAISQSLHRASLVLMASLAIRLVAVHLAPTRRLHPSVGELEDDERTGALLV